MTVTCVVIVHVGAGGVMGKSSSQLIQNKDEYSLDFLNSANYAKIPAIRRYSLYHSNHVT
jgi:hypothetical protein